MAIRCKICSEGLPRNDHRTRIEHAKAKGHALFKCGECDTEFLSSDSRQEHVVAKHHPKNMKCPMCPVQVVSEEILRRHLSKKHEVTNVNAMISQSTPLPANTVGKSAPSPKSAPKLPPGLNITRAPDTSNQQSKSASTSQSRTPSSDTLVSCKCSICFKTYSSASELSKHIDSKHTIICSMCKKSLREDELAPHQFKVHSATVKCPSPLCKMEFSLLKNYNQHLKSSGHTRVAIGYEDDVTDWAPVDMTDWGPVDGPSVPTTTSKGKGMSHTEVTSNLQTESPTVWDPVDMTDWGPVDSPSMPTTLNSKPKWAKGSNHSSKPVASRSSIGPPAARAPVHHSFTLNTKSKTKTPKITTPSNDLATSSLPPNPPTEFHCPEPECSGHSFQGNEAEFREHITVCHQKRCEGCFELFDFSFLLLSHLESCPRVCMICDLKLRNQEKLDEHHMVEHHTVLKCVCGEDYDFDRSQEHWTSSRVHPNCKICKIGFPDETGLKNHIDTEHCSFCEELTSDMKHHCSVEHGIPGCQCEGCVLLAAANQEKELEEFVQPTEEDAAALAASLAPQREELLNGHVDEPPSTDPSPSVLADSRSGFNDTKQNLASEGTDLGKDSAVIDVTATAIPVVTSKTSCRICFAESVDPVSTMCGHIFCQRCIVERLFKNVACPVCDKGILVKLDFLQP
ncbi:hypothetical protein C8Q75DRAFT_762081 [Abortiporus biennis]|nr:hypothetical protein C8Q75DRAFT_762081 [Abortiporus biennis]